MILRVTAKSSKGFWRAGRHWAGTTDFDTNDWPEADRKHLTQQLLGEHGGKLIVEELKGAAAKAAMAAKTGDGNQDDIDPAEAGTAAATAAG